MLKEKSAGAIIFRRDGELKYLLLHYRFKTDYWDFPRGNIEKGEGEQKTALREIKEETGIGDVQFLPGFAERMEWFYKREGQTVYKEATFFLAETHQKEIVLSKEHIGYAWLTYDKALKKLTFENAKDVMEKAHEFLMERE